MAQTQQSTMETAQRAFGHFTQGMGTGKWEPFLEMLADDFSFWFPVGQYQGENVGKARAAAFFEYASEAFNNELVVTLDGVTSNETTVVFEIRSQGHLRGKPYQNRGAISFDVRGDKICRYREYLSVVVQPKVESHPEQSPSQG
ncbi:nuclear transport factor 2 family protein [Coleofasciculus sp. FACHB-712]|uniref:nuclear transport factor 2 family protein n=1 Tax=Coleofasciculus sp. FACHB-712 TaxID=2692789 RepID=UPI001687C69F|nr:nuclear transport factor 2 family protein [Coleofasciculus sp. FACHB-712]MBD1945535.1 nuclear transport factor 2 family protein [Coleofasciculus sp. FACHB-712]